MVRGGPLEEFDPRHNLGPNPARARRRILSGILRLARQVGYARLVFLPRSRPESAAPRSLLPCGEFEYGIEPFRQPSLSRRWSWDPTSVCPSNRSDEVLMRTTGSGLPVSRIGWQRSLCLRQFDALQNSG